MEMSPLERHVDQLRKSIHCMGYRRKVALTSQAITQNSGSFWRYCGDQTLVGLMQQTEKMTTLICCIKLHCASRYIDREKFYLHFHLQRRKDYATITTQNTAFLSLNHKTTHDVRGLGLDHLIYIVLRQKLCPMIHSCRRHATGKRP